MSQSILIIDWKVQSVCEYAQSQLLVHLQWTDILVIQNWKMTHRITVPDQFTIERCLLLPGFNFEDGFPFFVSYGKDMFDLINVKTGRVESVIQGSAQNLRGQSAAFFTNRGNDIFDMDFCTTRLNKDQMYEYYWYQMRFNADFVKMLRDYGRLPIESI